MSFLPDDGEGAVPGWMQKMLRKSMADLPPGVLEGTGLPAGVLEGNESAAGDSYPGRSNFSERGLNTDTSPSSSDVPLSLSALPEGVEPTTSRRSEAGGEVSNKTLIPPSLESIGGQMAPNLFDKARQLIREYGTEEGLRRLREMDPDAAERFERERRGAPSDDGYSDGQSPVRDSRNGDDSP